MACENEIFISYARLDDLSLIEGRPGWVSDLHHDLGLRVTQQLGESAGIWRDPKLHGNDPIRDTLLQLLSTTKVLLSVVSPCYVNSKWCHLELDEFCKDHCGDRDVRVEGKSRIFKIIKTPVPREMHPRVLQQHLGYEFYKIDPETGRVRELHRIFGPEAEVDYWLKLDDLAQDVADCLKRLHGGDDTCEQESVYLATTSSELQEHYEAVKRELKRRGYEVLPDCDLPYVTSQLEEMVREQLKKCRLSVHMVGGSYGFVPEGTEKSVVEIQHEIAEQRFSDGDFAHVIWMSEGLDCNDHRQCIFLQGLQDELATKHHADLLKTSLEDLKEEILRRLSPPEKPAEDVGRHDHQEAAPKSVYLICDQRDLDHLGQLQDFLFDQRGYDVILPAFEGEESRIREYHEANLADRDAVLIFFGAADLPWLHRMLRDIEKSRGYGRNTAFGSKAIYMAPPITTDKDHFRSHQALVIRQDDAFSPELLQPFLDEIDGHA